MAELSAPDEALSLLCQWAAELGFAAVGVAGTDLAQAEKALDAWLAAGYAGEMDYMARHGTKRSRPQELVPGTVRVITVRMNYLDAQAKKAEEVLADPSLAYISRYALGRDYHKLVRRRLAKLARRMDAHFGPCGYRVFTDSAPVLEVALAQKSGLGWTGKHSLALAREAGSYFFLGEIYTDLPLPETAATTAHCGSCEACMAACPTQAIVAPGVVDARRCISYLTIELAGAIPLELRPLLGNRIYGCDDCQIVCPWNRRAACTSEPDFAVRHRLDDTSLAELFAWSEADFQSRMAGSAIYRLGHERWLRNIAVALGNAPKTPEAMRALQARRDDPSPLVREHVAWALARQAGQADGPATS